MQLFSRNKAIVALSLGALALGACGDDVTVPVAPAAPITLSITPPSANMNIGEAVNFAVQISGGTGAATLASCTTSSATVATATVSGSSCRVTAVGAGNATITASASTGQSAAASVSVAAPAAAISGLQVSPSAANVQVNQTVTIVPTVNKGAAAVAVAYTYATSTASVATVSAAGVVTAVGPGVATITVTATGTGTGFTSTTLTSAAAITVTALPTGMTSLNVSPATLALAAGSTAQVVANAQQPSGAAAATITYGTTAPAVATVSSMGLITAVGAGSAVITVTASSAANANFAAATLSGTVAVTVSPAAQISIASITAPYYFGGNTPVDVNNVNGQIQVNTALVTNGQLVTAVSAWVCQVGETVAACATRSGTPAAQQSFGTGGAASGTVSLTINTADFSVASDFSSATTKFANGQNVIVATVSTSAGLNSANSNLAILNFTNGDTFAARHVAPTNKATGEDNLTWYGGPGTTGYGTITVVPVMYTAGRTVSRATVGSTGTACAVSYEFVAGTDATPWTLTYGAGTSSGTFRACASTGTGTLNANVSAATDNAQNTMNFGLWATTTSVSPAVPAPAEIRVDYTRPDASAASIAASAIASQNGSSNNWINAAFKMDSTNNLTVATDVGGVGMALVPRIDVQGCPWVDRSTATPTWVTMATRTGADVAECATSAANTVYEARYIAADRLGNTVTSSNYKYSVRFGVDKTAPSVRYGAASHANGAIMATASGDSTLFQIEALDERSGLNSAVASAADHYLVRANRMSTTNRSGACLVGNYPTISGVPATNAGGSFITAPNCLMVAMAGSYGAVTADGYSPLPPIAVTTVGNDGYYTYRARVRDEAGNVVTTDLRSVMLQKSAPFSVTADNLITSLTASYAGAFTGIFKDSVETAAYGLRLRFQNTGANTVVLGYPMVATSAVTFNNVITRDSVTSLSTPFTSGVRLYTNIEYTNVDGTLSATPTVDSIGAHGVYAQNFAGLATSGFSSFLAGITTFDAVRWGNGVSGVKNANLLRFSMDTSTVAGYNSPVGGLKARAFGNLDLTNSPFARVDFYHQTTSGTWEYAGSVDATATPCITPSQSCGVYVAENATQRAFTYVLRTVGTGAESFGSLSAGGLGSGSWVAVGVHSTGGRVLLTGASFDILPPA